MDEFQMIDVTDVKTIELVSLIIEIKNMALPQVAPREIHHFGSLTNVSMELDLNESKLVQQLIIDPNEAEGYQFQIALIDEIRNLIYKRKAGAPKQEYPKINTAQVKAGQFAARIRYLFQNLSV